MKDIFKKFKKNLKFKFRLFYIKEELYFYLAYCVFIFFPNLIYIISGKSFSITKKIRWVERKNPEDEWFFYKKFKKKHNEVNIIFKGNSLMNYEHQINKKIPSIFVNFYEKPKLKNYFIGISGKDPIEFKKIGISPYIKFNGSQISIKNGKPIWKINKIKNNRILKFKGFANKIESTSIAHKKNFNNNSGFSGIGIQIIFLIGSLSKKVNIYGWDYYLNEPIENLSFFSCVNYLFQRSFKNQYQGILRKRRFYETVFNIYYAYRLTKTRKYKVFSNLSCINKHYKIIKKIKKILIHNA